MSLSLAGSISFEKSLLAEVAAKKVTKNWITLFDDPTDDLYDGDFTEDDPETPMIQFWFRLGAEPEPTPKRERSQAAAPVQQEVNEAHSVEYLKADLQSKLKELVTSLSEDQQALFAEETERISVLANLETVHTELEGEHRQDAEVTETLTTTKITIQTEIKTRNEDISATIAQLKSAIAQVEELLTAVKGDIATEEAKTVELQAVVDAPEDIEEVGLSEESRAVRAENEELRNKKATLTETLLAENKEKDELLAKHSDLVSEYNGAIAGFNTQLLALKQDSLLTSVDLAEAESKATTGKDAAELTSAKVGFQESTIARLEALLAQMRADFAASDEHYADYIKSLKDIGLSHATEASGLSDDLLKTEGEIRDLQQRIEEQKSRLNHHASESDRVKAIDYDRRIGVLSDDLRRADGKRKDAQDKLENGQGNWSFKVRVFADQHAERREERDRRIAEVEELLAELRSASTSANETLEETDIASHKIQVDENLDECAKGLQKENEGVGLKNKWAEDERDKLFQRMEEALENAKQKEAQIRDQEDQIRAFNEEIRRMKELIEEKKAEI